MFSFAKKQKISIEFNDYVIRLLLCQGTDLSKLLAYEFPLETGTIVEDVIRDEMALYETVKQAVHELKIKRQNVRFFVPDSTVMMKTFEHPLDIDPTKLKGYVELELGNTVHLPFSNPLIDVYDETPGDGQATIFAAPAEEIQKFMGVLDDVSLQPTIADIRALSNIRFLKTHKQLSPEQTYLIADWSINGLSIVIYSNGKVEFLRYQSIETSMKKWSYRFEENDNLEFFYEGDITDYHTGLIDQIAGIDRILNFYKFSLYKGEKSVTEIVLMGDSPTLPHIFNEMKLSYDFPITLIDDEFVNASYPLLKGKHAALIGLTLKEGE